jgi:hypothetical protein
MVVQLSVDTRLWVASFESTSCNCSAKNDVDSPTLVHPSCAKARVGATLTTGPPLDAALEGATLGP